jgi:chromate transporter
MYWHLGLIAFGGPSAHVAILRDHLCIRNHWMDEDALMELFALCVGLPGPTSTQLVISTAVTHAGPLGGMIAYVFWNLPGESSVVVYICINLS